MPGNQSPAPPYFSAKSNIRIQHNETIRLQVLREKFEQEDGVQGLRNLFNRSNLSVVRIKKLSITKQSAYCSNFSLIKDVLDATKRRQHIRSLIRQINSLVILAANHLLKSVYILHCQHISRRVCLS